MRADAAMWALESRFMIALKTDYYDQTSRSFRVRDFLSFCDAVLTVAASQQPQPGAPMPIDS